MKVSLVLACAGKGERTGLNKNKLLVSVGGTTCIEKTFSTFYNSLLIDEYIIVCADKDKKEISSLLPTTVKFVCGGDTRTQSIKNALEIVTGDIVLIHDGARPFVCKDTIKDCIDTAEQYGSGIATVISCDTICKTKNGEIDAYLGKSELYNVQTPQAFKTELIKKAYSFVGNNTFNDDGEVFYKYIGKVHLAKGNRNNIKITYKEDLLLLKQAPLCRIGTGFDCHKLVENRKLILGGIEIPHTKGLLGHSDADVLTHAIMDAILSAISLRDIGTHFPDSDTKYKDADSIELLKQVLAMIKEQGYAVYNISAVIMAEKPKLSPYIVEITKNLANIIGIQADAIGIGATTLEGLGFIGREEGICVNASASLIKQSI